MGATREAEKEKKYEDTLEGLRQDGWEPVLYILVLGTLGEHRDTFHCGCYFGGIGCTRIRIG
eukprot:4601769-Pyramimonas_sp.AAC.1